jgi:bifunctional DNA primase/polymerase-like protein
MTWPGQFTRPLLRLLLRNAAYRYVTHQWPVIPGAPRRGDRFDCGEPGCLTVGCHPAVPDWEDVASSDPAQVAAWWDHVDHGVLLATGRCFDVLELASPVGRRVAHEVRGPAAVAPPERWMFLMRRGGSLCAELAGSPCVVLHRAGSWIPAPPTRLPAGQVRWEVRPRVCDWSLPDPADVQRATIRALDADHQRQACWPMNGTARHIPE